MRLIESDMMLMNMQLLGVEGSENLRAMNDINLNRLYELLQANTYSGTDEHSKHIRQARIEKVATEIQMRKESK